ncbi:extracellular solute-binding protein [Bosea sp. BK604]|uniref:ABC transporter substrate-binding protein n=1 Tax=Bosea sp. BK604 TaxID=2512180 RepID=UPI0010529E14|nr:extracellular solute-binding protein [Bosea sp. BK604]TCR65544.1 carbohydrate ABC transporter substrate-binding protein (CUT1 family) [Bosea sp. BK604]
MFETHITRRGLVGGAATLAAASTLPAPFVRAQAQRRLVFWHSYSQKERSDAMRQIADRFEKANPGVKVDIEIVPWPAFPQKWPAAMAAGTLPDVTILLAENAVPMALAGALNPMDDVVKALGGAEAFKGDIARTTGLFRGQHVSVPHYVHNRLLVYRKDRLAEAGMQPPVTWDDALKVAIATTKAPDHFGWIPKLAKGDTGGGFLLWMMARSANGSFFDKDGKVSFDSAPVKDATAFIVELARKAGGPGVTDYKINDNFSLVNSGKTSLAEDSAAIVAGAAKDAPAVAEQLDATFMPRRKRVGNLLGGISVALPKGKNPADGKEFARFLFAEENYTPFLLTIPLFMFPSLKRAEGPSFFDNPTIKRFRNVVDVTLKGLEDTSLAGMEHGLNPYAGPVMNSYAVEDMFQRILLRNEPIDQAVGTTAKQIEKVVGDVRTRFDRG